MLLYGIDSILLFFLLSYFFKPYHLLSFLVALIYSVNPIKAEIADYLRSRSDLMSATFFLLLQPDLKLLVVIKVDPINLEAIRNLRGLKDDERLKR